MRRKGVRKQSAPGLEAELRSAQRELNRRQEEVRRALHHRDRVAWRLFHNQGYLQKELADIVNMEAVIPITEDAFQKSFRRMRDSVVDLPMSEVS